MKDKIENLRTTIRDARERMEMGDFETIEELHSIILPADEARGKIWMRIHRIDQDALDEVSKDFDYIYDYWEDITGIEFTPNALIGIKKDAEHMAEIAEKIQPTRPPFTLSRLESIVNTSIANVERRRQ